MFRKKSKGFTLIELMIVIAIIAILAAILVPNFIKARAQGQLAACKSNLKNIATALEMYATDNDGRYPGAIAIGTFTPDYLRTVPTCPAATTTYTYTKNTTGADAFTVWCANTTNVHSGVAGITGSSSPYYNSAGGLQPD